jgi:hypothetical protein
MNRDEPDVIMTKIREEKDGRGNKSGICGDFSPGGRAVWQASAGGAGAGTRQGRASGNAG